MNPQLAVFWQMPLFAQGELAQRFTYESQFVPVQAQSHVHEYCPGPANIESKKWKLDGLSWLSFNYIKCCLYVVCTSRGYMDSVHID